MKKFISALSSFVIAATAMGGSMVIPTNAATNGDVAETIVSMRSGGKNEIRANAGETIPVEVYIPQSSGFNSLLLKFAIGKNGNLDDTKGQGSVYDRKGTEIKNYKDAFGNYGIEMVPKGDEIGGKKTDFSYPACLESGNISEFSLDAGDLPDTGIAMFNPEAWSILYQATPEINSNKNVDSYGAWVAAGGVLEEDYDYSNYTPAYTWTKDESWAYNYTLTKFDLKLPANLPDGTYVFDVYKDVYINTHPGSLFDDDNNPLPDDKRGDAQSNFAGVSGVQKFSSEKLTIVVGEPASVTTEAPVVTTEAPVVTTEAPAVTTEAPVITTEAPAVTTTSGPAAVTEAPVATTASPAETEPAATQPPENFIIYNLVPHGKEGQYDDAQENGLNYNRYKAAPGEAIQVDWTVKGDKGTAGIQMTFDFTQVEYIGGKRGTGYRIVPTYSDYNNTSNMKKGEVIYTWAQSDEVTAKDGSTIYSFNIKAPESGGTYFVGLNEDPKEVSKVVPKAQDQQHYFVMYGLQIIVDGPVVTTEAPAETTAAPVETTAAPVETTVAPVETTAAPVETTVAPVETTAAPVETTAAPVETTAAPAQTTAVQEATTAAPAETTAVQVATVAPTQTTVAPTAATTAAPATTAAAATTAVENNNTLIYNLIPRGKDYTSAEASGKKNNVYNATAGEKLTIDWTVKGDKGTAGIQMNFDFSQVDYVEAKRGDAYRINPTFSDPKNTEGLKKGEVVYTWAQSEESTAKDNAVIHSFVINVPNEKGTYTIGLSQDPNDTNKVVPRHQENPYKFEFYGLEIVVETPGDSTTAPGQTTTDQGNRDGDTLYGDVNCDGAVRIGDVVLLNRYLAKNATVSPQGLLNADCEKDGKLDGKDSVKIKKYLALMIGASELGKASN